MSDQVRAGRLLELSKSREVDDASKRFASQSGVDDAFNPLASQL